MQLALSDGWVEPELAEELPELGLVHAPVEVRPGRARPSQAPPRALADRYTGGKVIHMRQDPVPWAYRVFSRRWAWTRTPTAPRSSRSRSTA